MRSRTASLPAFISQRSGFEDLGFGSLLQGYQTPNPDPSFIPNNFKRRAGGVFSHAKPDCLPAALRVERLEFGVLGLVFGSGVWHLVFGV